MASPAALEQETLGSELKEDACADAAAGIREEKLGPPKEPWME